MNTDALRGGFSDAPIEAARTFRAALDAISRPGRINTVAGVQPPAPLSIAAGALILALCDGETPICLRGQHDTRGVSDWITFHANAPIVTAAQAQFAIGTLDALAPLDVYACGTPEYPDRSATLIVEMPVLQANGARLTGPGIKSAAYLSLPGDAAFVTNRLRYPLGLDFFLCSGNKLAGLPRTTVIEAA